VPGDRGGEAQGHRPRQPRGFGARGAQAEAAGAAGDDQREEGGARATERTARLADERGAAAEGAHREADQQRGVRLEGRKWRWGG